MLFVGFLSSRFVISCCECQIQNPNSPLRLKVRKQDVLCTHFEVVGRVLPAIPAFLSGGDDVVRYMIARILWTLPGGVLSTKLGTESVCIGVQTRGKCEGPIGKPFYPDENKHDHEHRSHADVQVCKLVSLSAFSAQVPLSPDQLHFIFHDPGDGYGSFQNRMAARPLFDGPPYPWQR